MISHLVKTVGHRLAEMVTEQVVHVVVERLLTRERSLLDLQTVPRVEAEEYARAHPGAMDGAAFALAAMKHLVTHPSHAAGVLAALRELGLARIENPGCVIFVNSSVRS